MFLSLLTSVLLSTAHADVGTCEPPISFDSLYGDFVLEVPAESITILIGVSNDLPGFGLQPGGGVVPIDPDWKDAIALAAAGRNIAFVEATATTIDELQAMGASELCASEIADGLQEKGMLVKVTSGEGAEGLLSEALAGFDGPSLLLLFPDETW